MKITLTVRKILSLVLTAILVLSTCMAYADTPDGGNMYHIEVMQTWDSRLKLRDYPEGNVIGQYYAGTQVEMLEKGIKWDKVKIGGRTGYMMDEFLSNQLPQDTTEQEYAFDGILSVASSTYYPGFTELISDTNGKNTGKIPYGAFLKVLGTVGDTMLHVMYHDYDTGENLYGLVNGRYVVATNDVYIVNNNGNDTVNLRRSPSKSDENIVAKLFTGTKMRIKFDNNTAGDGWLYVGVGDYCGYIMDGFWSETPPDYTPCPLYAGKSPINVTGCYPNKIHQGEPAFIIGKASDNKFYLCVAQLLVGDTDSRWLCCYVDKNDVDKYYTTPAEVSAKMTLTQQIFGVGHDGELRQGLSNGKNVEVKAGTPVKIRGSYPYSSFERYVSMEADWAQIEFIDDQGYVNHGYVPKFSVEYDRRLDLSYDFDSYYK